MSDSNVRLSDQHASSPLPNGECGTSTGWHPLSASQKRIWFAQALRPGDPFLTVSRTLRFFGRPRLDLLQEALAALGAHHPILRTEYREQGGELAQRVIDQPLLPHVEDYSHKPERLSARVQVLATSFLELHDAPPVRFTLVLGEVSKSFLVVAAHHVSIDAYSIEQIVHELANLYSTFESGSGLDLPSLVHSYRDAVAIETKEDHHRSLAFWAEQLGNVSQTLELPRDRPRLQSPSFRTLAITWEVDDDLVARLNRMAAEAGASLFMVLLAAFELLLWRWTGQETFAVGIPVQVRPRGFDRVAGCFVNTIAVPAKIAPESSFIELIQIVRNRMLMAYEHRTCPFDTLVQAVVPRHLQDRSRNPICQAALNFVVQSEAELTFGDIKTERLPPPDPASQFDVLLSCFLSGRHLTFRWQFAKDLFNPGTAHRMTEHAQVLLQKLVEYPHAPIHDHAILTTEERQTIARWTAKALPSWSEQHCIHTLFERQAAFRSDAVALEFEGQQTSYAVLERRANQLARHLGEFGIGPGKQVAIRFERSPEMVVAIIAVLKAGGAYVPLDPLHPPERLAYMIRDSGATVLVTLSRPELKLDVVGVQTVFLDSEAAVIARHAESAPAVTVQPDDLAYCMYTSGSTGVPKAVAVTHHNVTRLFLTTKSLFDFGPDSISTLFHSYAFDVSVWEMWSALLYGGRLVIVPYLVSRSPSEFLRLLAERQVTALNQTPSAFYQLIDAVAKAPSIAARLALRHIVLAGEALDFARAARWYDLLPQAGSTLVNMYGPTEITVFATHFSLIPETLGELAAVSVIGTAVPDLSVYILDPWLRVVPVGVHGELYVAGAGLARGYLNRPDLTAERFVPNPFGPVGSRLYRTGDLGRYLPNGKIEFLGRADHQVKVRGHRIELGEISSALLACEGVRDAFVLLDNRSARQERLIAYVVSSRPDANPTSTELRDRLRRLLPGYMLPYSYVFLDEIPLNTNGKLDRNGLPKPSPQPHSRATHIAPRTPIEAALAEIWQDLLEVSEIGVHDDFFELGGHSLLATTLMGRIRSSLGLEIPIRVLFEIQTIAGLAERIAEIPSVRLPVWPKERPDVIPLSYGQESLWFLNRLEGGIPIYNVAIVRRLLGVFEPAAFELALNDVVARHESLRTIFQDGPHGACQLVLPPEVAQVPVTRFNSTEADLPPLLVQVVEHRFDLTRELPVRASLFRLDTNQHALVVTLHHIACDGWSLGTFQRDLSTAYNARRQHLGVVWPELPLQYADFAIWQRDWLGSNSNPDSRISRQLAYWREALDGMQEELWLPVDRPRPALASHRGDRVDCSISSDLHAKLVDLARSNQVSLFMVLHAAVATLLTRLGAGSDIAIGTPVVGRNDERLGELIGFFVNTLVLRTDISGNPSFQDLLARVRIQDLAAYANQDVPFERLVEILKPSRSLARNPLFQVMLSLQNDPDNLLLLDGLTSRVEAIRGAHTKFDLTFRFAERRQVDGSLAGLAGHLEFAEELFDRASAESMTARFERLLVAAAATPSIPIWDFELLDPEERSGLLEQGDGMACPLPLGTIVDLFEAQAVNLSAMTALLYNNGKLSFSELNEKADRLACVLSEAKVGPEDIVAIALPRSPDLVVAIIATLKAGAAYLPLDPDYPRERLDTMLHIADPVCVILNTDTSHLIAESYRTVALDSDAVQQKLVRLSATRIADRIRPLSLDSAAYLLFTSGSTGTPKAVLVTHRGLSNYLLWCVDTYYREGGFGSPLLHSIGFDSGITTLFGPLLAGLPVTLLPANNIDELVASLSSQPAPYSVLKVTPSHLRALNLQLPYLEACSAPRVLMVGGDALMPSDVAEWQMRFPAVRIVNSYGPTEATVACASFELTGSAARSTSIPIGTPIQNTQIYILDKTMRPAPVGIPGEIFVAGAGLARGYLRRPDLTAERFTPNPFGPPGSRMYRTGDLGRRMRTGIIEFMGRIDRQLKIRGARIELDEVEDSLRQCAGVAGAAVTAPLSLDGIERQLVAYVAPRAGATLDAEEVRVALRRRLPGHMVPDFCVVLQYLPLNANGKVDYRALPAPPRLATLGRAPRTPQEEVLARLFAEVLDLDHVGIDDDFFGLGGHSIGAIRLISRVRTTLDIELPIRALFEAPSISELARRIADQDGVRTPLRPMQRVVPAPLSFAQERLWFLQRLIGTKPVYNIPICLRIRGCLDTPALTLATSDVIIRHESLRTLFPETDGMPSQMVVDSDAARMVIAVEDVSTAELDERMADATAYCFQLTSELPFRGWLFRTGEQDHVLVLLLHHMVSDAWSRAPLLRDLSTAYSARAQGRVPIWAPLDTQYIDYALWQREVLGSDADPKSVMSRQLAYWSNALEGLPAQLNLPLDRPRPAVASYQGNAVRFSIDAGLHRRLLARAATARASLFMCIQACIAVLLSRLGCGDDIPLGAPVANRLDDALDQAIGLYMNTLVFRIDTSGDPDFDTLLARTRETALNAFTNQDLPFDRLVELLTPTRSTAYHPLFQVMVAFQTIPDCEQVFANLKTEMITVDSATSKFDLSFGVREHRGIDGCTNGIDVRIEYSTDLFERKTVEDMSYRLRQVLEFVGSGAQVPISQTNIFLPNERPTLWQACHGSDFELLDTIVPTMFERQVALVPNDVALLFHSERLSYGVLNGRANQLARWLIERHIGPEDVVAVALPRSIELVVAILGILKAGAAYMPLDPDYPRTRLEFMLENATPALVLTTIEASTHMPATTATVAFDDPGLMSILACCSTDNIKDNERVRHLGGASPAYVVYTSGSTGQPKGVVGLHLGLVNRLSWAAWAYPYQTGKPVLARTSLSWIDGSTELLGPLLHGATVLIADGTTSRDPAQLAALIASYQVERVTSVPSLLPMLLNRGGSGLLRSCQTWIVAGDVLMNSHVVQLRETCPEAAIVNLFGCSEASGDSLFSECEPGWTPIGRPIWNTQVYVLDAHLNLLTIGVIGELYIAGAGLARGYLGRPSLTAERFVPDPFSPAGGRMYRTGDRVVLRTDGSIHYVGRSDNQVKIRGMRLELTEVEHALRRCPGVTDCAVTPWHSSAGADALIAYITLEQGVEQDLGQVRTFLQGSLPAYMIPNRFVVLNEIPKGVTGKVDRRALPSMGPDRPGLPNRSIEPTSDVEARIVGIWQEILQIAGVGPEDTFFDLGGNSLSLVRVQWRIEQDLSVSLTLVDLFRFTTVRALAERIGSVENQG